MNSDRQNEDWEDAWANEEADSESELPPLEREALDWVALLTSGKATEADRSRFATWRAQSAQHEAAASAARALWVGMGQVLTPQHADAQRKQQRAISPVRQPMRWLALAASLLIAVTLGFQSLHDWRYDYVAQAGDLDSISLQDGSTVELNSGSALNVHYSDRERHIELARGEAFFDVTHNPEVPFVVMAGNARVRVLGTAFSVRKLDDGVLVTVERGRVEVRGGEGVTVVHPNERVRYEAGTLGGIEAANPYTDLAWRRGRLIIEDQPLAEVVKELNRYYSGMLVVSGDRVASRRLNAVIDLRHIDQWLAALDESQPIEIQRLGPVVILR